MDILVTYYLNWMEECTSWGFILIYYKGVPVGWYMWNNCRWDFYRHFRGCLKSLDLFLTEVFRKKNPAKVSYIPEVQLYRSFWRKHIVIFYDGLRNCLTSFRKNYGKKMHTWILIESCAEFLKAYNSWKFVNSKRNFCRSWLCNL